MSLKLVPVLGTFLLALGFGTSSPLNHSTWNWQACPTALAPSPRGIQCTYLDVPMDWDDPQHAVTVRLGMARLPARVTERRIGNLFYNPGGPGEQATAVLAEIDAGSPRLRIHDDILDRFDIIGVDIRGSGLSDPLKCDLDIYGEVHSLTANALPIYPNDEAEFEKLVKVNQAFRQSCLNLTGSPLFDYMDTISIVKDHEAVRKALGGEQLSWLGQSYGTQLGTQYAELFPNSFRAIALDCSQYLAQPEIAIFVEGAASVEATFKYFLEWCDRTNVTNCPLAHQNQTAEEIWTQLLDHAALSPIPARICKSSDAHCASPSISRDAILAAALEYLVHPLTGFPLLAEGIYNASFSNDASTFATFLDPALLQPYSMSYHYANVAVTCQDWAHNVTSYTDMHYKQFIGESEAPLMRGISTESQFQYQCYGLPPPLRNPPHVIEIPQSNAFPMVFMVANLYDPATPMAMSVNLRDEIGKERAVLATRVAAGHTVYFQEDAFSGEAVHAINRYLLELKTPEQGTVFYS